MTASFPLSTEPLDMHAEIVKAKHTYGLLYGLSTGLAFALACWAPDAILLYQAHAFYPWLKLLLGAALFMLIGGLAGWLAARLDHGLLAPLL